MLFLSSPEEEEEDTLSLSFSPFFQSGKEKPDRANLLYVHTHSHVAEEVEAVVVYNQADLLLSSDATSL